mgnify:CR=1 FL=1
MLVPLMEPWLPLVCSTLTSDIKVRGGWQHKRLLTQQPARQHLRCQLCARSAGSGRCCRGGSLAAVLVLREAAVFSALLLLPIAAMLTPGTTYLTSKVHSSLHYLPPVLNHK